MAGAGVTTANPPRRWREGPRPTAGRNGERYSESVAHRLLRVLAALRDAPPEGLTIEELIADVALSRASVYRNLYAIDSSSSWQIERTRVRMGVGKPRVFMRLKQ